MWTQEVSIKSAETKSKENTLQLFPKSRPTAKLESSEGACPADPNVATNTASKKMKNPKRHQKELQEQLLDEGYWDIDDGTAARPTLTISKTKHFKCRRVGAAC